MKNGFMFYDEEWSWYRLKDEEELVREFGPLWRDKLNAKWPLLLDEHFGEDLEYFLEDIQMVNGKSRNGAIEGEVFDGDSDDYKRVMITGDMVVRSDNYPADEYSSDYSNEDYETHCEDDTADSELDSVAKELQREAKATGWTASAAGLGNIQKELEAESSTLRQAAKELQKEAGAATFSAGNGSFTVINSNLYVSNATPVELVPPSDSPLGIAKDLGKEAILNTIKSRVNSLPNLGDYENAFAKKCTFNAKELLRDR